MPEGDDENDSEIRQMQTEKEQIIGEIDQEDVMQKIVTTHLNHSCSWLDSFWTWRYRRERSRLSKNERVTLHADLTCEIATLLQ